ncbi:MAG: carboxypeptidase-like regulatory domain-containing protein [Planctomycetota bacterium]|nr:carboxypeptidase-like regulatory domain-containing protein [Planctomycetota bacterium]
MSTLFAATLLTLASAPQALQQAPRPLERRAGVHGTVLDPNKKPVSGAEVWLLHRPMPWTERAGHFDMVRARSGRNGKFKAQLLTGRPYAAWAAWGLVKGTGPVTTVVDNVVAGDRVTLTAPRMKFGTRVEMKGLAQWQAYAPLEFRLRPMIATMWTRPFKLNKNSIGTLPVVPMGTTGDIEILASDGSLIGCLPTFLSSRSGMLREIEVPPPSTIALAIFSAKTEQAIEGAVVQRRAWSRPGNTYPGRNWGMAGRSNPEGSCKIRVMASRDPIQRPDEAEESWVVSAEGYADQMLGAHRGSLFVANSYVTRQMRGPIVVRLNDAKPLTGRLMISPGIPGSNIRLMARVAWQVAGAPVFDPDPKRPLLLPDYHTVANERGEYSFPSIPEQVRAISICAVLDRADSKELPDFEVDGFCTSPFLPIYEGPSRPTDLPSVSLERFERVRVSYEAPAGAEHRPLRVRVHRRSVGSPPPCSLDIERFTDDQGRIGIWLRRGETYDLFAYRVDIGWVTHTLRLPTDGKVVDVPLRPFARIAGKILTHKQSIPAWAHIDVNKASAKRAAGVAGEISMINEQLLHGWIDDEGHFALRYIPAAASPLVLIAKGRQRPTMNCPLYESKPLVLGTKSKKGIVIVLDVPPEWLREDGK